MSMKNMYEIFAEFERQADRESKRQVLIDNKSELLIQVLQAAYHPAIQFDLPPGPPPYKPAEDIPGLGYQSMTDVMKKIYIWVKGNSRVSPNLSRTRKELLFIELLESLEPREAAFAVKMFNKDLEIKYLTPKLIEDVFPGILH